MKKHHLLYLLLAGALCLSGCNVVGDTQDPNKDIDDVDKGDYTGLVKLVIDGGSQNAAYNSTESLTYDKYNNPYPYNTLERLAEEWNAENAEKYGYYFTVAETSINNDRETMLPMLSQGTAPEIVYYLGTTIAQDQNKGYFYDLKEVMETPNKYSEPGEAGSVRWRDLYQSELYTSFFSPDGQIFTVNMEQNPIGLLYNKTLFEAAGIEEEPETFFELMQAQDKLHAYAESIGRADADNDAKYIVPYYRMYDWYSSALETTLLGEVMDSMDVIRKDGYIDAEEFSRAFYVSTDGTIIPTGGGETAIYSPDDERTVELYRLYKLLTKYYPANNDYYAKQGFIAGNVAMIEVTGGSVREFIDEVDGKFEVDVMPYPVLTAQPEGAEESEYYTTFNREGYFVQRGLSGYSTGWAISNSAMKKDEANGNTKCVDACIDLLMYLSCFKNNDKMVNDLGFAVPLSGNTEYQYFKKLIAVFRDDQKNEKSIAWGAATTGSSMNKSYYDAVEHFRKDVRLSSEPLKSQLSSLVKSFRTSILELARSNGWDQNSWVQYK